VPKNNSHWELSNNIVSATILPLDMEFLAEGIGTHVPIYPLGKSPSNGKTVVVMKAEVWENTQCELESLREEVKNYEQKYKGYRSD